MKYSIAYLKVFLSFAFFFISFTSNAQKPASLKQLQKAWKFESATIDDPQLSSGLDLVNLHYEFYDQIVFNNDTVTLMNENKIQVTPLEISDNVLGVNLLGKSIVAEWAIYDDKLYLEFNTTYIDDKTKNSKLLLIYTSK